jgi:hypothetical protein
MFDTVDISPERIEFVLSYVVPAALALLFVALGAFGLNKTVTQFVAIWRLFRPLIDEPTDAAIIVAARLLNMTPEKLAELLKLWNDQIDPPPPQEKILYVEARESVPLGESWQGVVGSSSGKPIHTWTRTGEEETPTPGG